MICIEVNFFLVINDFCTMWLLNNYQTGLSIMAGVVDIFKKMAEEMEDANMKMMFMMCVFIAFVLVAGLMVFNSFVTD